MSPPRCVLKGDYCFIGLIVISAAVAVLCGVILLRTSEKSSGSKLVIDNDAGADDAFAIFLALLYQKHHNGPEVLALTTVNGNTKEPNVYLNNQKVLKVANSEYDVPIYRGSSKSIVITPEPTPYFGEDGLGDTGEDYGDLVPAREQSAVAALIRLSKEYKDELTVVTIGTLTNVALAVRLDPDFLHRLAHLYVGAGHIHDEYSPDAEFNASMDVEAYDIITQTADPDKVTIIPFSQVITTLNISKEWRMEVLGALDTNIIKAQNKFEAVSLEKEKRWQSLDPAVMAITLQPDLVNEYKYSQNDIILCGDERGKNTNKFVDKADANVRVVHSINKERYQQFLLDVFSQDG